MTGKKAPEGRLLDKMVAATQAIGRQSAKVRIGAEDVAIYWTPITVADTKAVESLHPETEFDHNLYMICRKVEDKDGKKLFRMGDKPRLEAEVDLGMLAQMNVAMRADVPATRKDAREELEKNPD